MPRMIIKIKDQYFEWSTVVDAPITYGMRLCDLRKHIKEEYGNEGLRDLPERLQRVDEAGTSALGRSLANLIECNRAGKNEARLTADEIYEQYQAPKT